MTQRLQCLICLDVLLLNESAAVRCGHVFHLHCILQWFENCETCPVCRKRATRRELIRHLFFQIEENKSFNFNNTNPSEMHNQLQIALDNLEKMKQDAAKAKSEADKEKLANLESVSRLNMQQIRHLESMLAKQLDVEKELQKYRKRLQAAAFYKLLSSVKDEPVMEIDKYIASEGLEVKRFIVLLRRQLKDAMKTVENQKEELQRSRKKISELQKKLSEHKNLNVALHKELGAVRTDSSQTIMDATVEEVIPFRPVQHSFDVDKSRVSPTSLITSAYRSTSENNAVVEVISGTTSIRSSSIGKATKNELKSGIDCDVEEVFVPPVIRRCATTTPSRRIPLKTLTVRRSKIMRNMESL